MDVFFAVFAALVLERSLEVALGAYLTLRARKAQIAGIRALVSALVNTPAPSEAPKPWN